MNILIAYFSHGGENLIDDRIVDLHGNGNTKQAAKELENQLSALGHKVNLFEIEPLLPYPHSYDECNTRSRQEYQDGSIPLINAGPNGYEAYDIIFLGYPNWYGTIPGPIKAFLRDHATEGKTLIPFVTHGGQIFLYSLDAIKELAPKAKMVEGFAIAAPYINQAPYVIKEWLEVHAELLK